MRGVVLLAMAGTTVAYVVLTLEVWALLVGFSTCAAATLACLVLKK
ncbi:hypothetical protein [Amycolatopsis azurea]|uniref:Uncharacterized protein n=1 Tax=Amycolatopsis azurea DSM 43854 TaxID=1238180 RepID=M2QA97_9PSEU|nr:hypothetical protein [Amycolatopsis azurea]EMD22977.1 hypothetical protein C791_7794 [Amycolatopsis azurea DSM 43854]